MRPNVTARGRPGEARQAGRSALPRQTNLVATSALSDTGLVSRAGPPSALPTRTGLLSESPRRLRIPTDAPTHAVDQYESAAYEDHTSVGKQSRMTPRRTPSIRLSEHRRRRVHTSYRRISRVQPVRLSMLHCTRRTIQIPGGRQAPETKRPPQYIIVRERPHHKISGFNTSRCAPERADGWMQQHVVQPPVRGRGDTSPCVAPQWEGDRDRGCGQLGRIRSPNVMFGRAGPSVSGRGPSMSECEDLNMTRGISWGCDGQHRTTTEPAAPAIALATRRPSAPLCRQRPQLAVPPSAGRAGR